MQLARAQVDGVPLPIAMALATASADGRPSVRMVLLRKYGLDGFVFFTHTGSRKGQELRSNPYAALCFWWPPREEQIRIEGHVVPVRDEEADEYWSTRPRGSQLAAAASPQSQRLPSRQQYEDAVRSLDVLYRSDVPRPTAWSGFRVIPQRLEFWYGQENRMHERFVYERDGDGWTSHMLYP